MATLISISIHLMIYFLINLFLSICNKLVLEQVPTPWLLTSTHAIFTSVGCFTYLRAYKRIPRQQLSGWEHVTLSLFSCLFTINIAISNESLSHVSLAFHQAVRSTSPILTIIMQGFWHKRVVSLPVYMSVVAISIGIILATSGDYSCTINGFFLTLLGMALATFKTIMTNTLLTGSLKLHPFEVLTYTCPLAAVVSLSYAYTNGELRAASTLYKQELNPWSLLILITANGILAFAQNLTSFYTNKVAGALCIAVAANLKQMFTIILAIGISQTRFNSLGKIGLLIVVLSTSYCSWESTRQQCGNEEIGSALNLAIDQSLRKARGTEL